MIVGRRSAEGRRNEVRRARRAVELTQAELAAAVGVTRQTIASVEAGNYAPSVYLALAIADQLGSTVEALFAGEPSPRPSGPSTSPATTPPPGVRTSEGTVTP
jgi:putative transcriptional regulator